MADKIPLYAEIVRTDERDYLFFMYACGDDYKLNCATTCKFGTIMHILDFVILDGDQAQAWEFFRTDNFAERVADLRKQVEIADASFEAAEQKEGGKHVH
jgi:hypothetical protein